MNYHYSTDFVYPTREVIAILSKKGFTNRNKRPINQKVINLLERRLKLKPKLSKKYGKLWSGKDVEILIDYLSKGEHDEVC